MALFVQSMSARLFTRSHVSAKTFLWTSKRMSWPWVNVARFDYMLISRSHEITAIGFVVKTVLFLSDHDWLCLNMFNFVPVGYGFVFIHLCIDEVIDLCWWMKYYWFVLLAYRYWSVVICMAVILFICMVILLLICFDVTSDVC